MPHLSLTLLEGTYAIHRLQPDAPVPSDVKNSPFFAAIRTQEELSLVLPTHVVVLSDKKEPGWAGFKVDGELEFGLVGILAELTTVLAKAGIAIFALSTYTTDYLLVKSEKVESAKQALASSGCKISEEAQG